MENFDIDFWENILSRQLDKDEKKIIHGIWNENSLNVDIKCLKLNLINSYCYIKDKTNNVGNCLFESLASLGLGDNDLGIIPHKMIRQNVASILLSVKTEVGFFPNIDLTPEEIFTNSNDIEFIKDNNTSTVYEYDYDMMIIDLNSSYSWERLPTEFILMVVSRIYQVEILIYHNKTDYIHKINVFDNNHNVDIIRLGQINEEHYFPIEEIPDDLKFDSDVVNEILNTQIKYDNNIKKFKIWSKLMMDSMETNHNSINKIYIEDKEFDNLYLNKKFNINNNVEKIVQNDGKYSCVDFEVELSVDTKQNLEEKKYSLVIMKTNKELFKQKIDDYKNISDLEDFDVI